MKKEKIEKKQKRIVLTYHLTFDDDVALKEYLSYTENKDEDLYEDISIALMGSRANFRFKKDGVAVHRVIEAKNNG